MRYNFLDQPSGPDAVSDTGVTVAPTATATAEPQRVPIVQEGSAAVRKDRDALITAAFGVPDAPPVTVRKDQMAVACTLRYDASIPQCDHFDYHASYSPAFCLLVVDSRARTEALARKALEVMKLFSNLPGTQLPTARHWTWHSETHGHGNYLMGPAFELPAGLQGFETAGINKLPVRHVRWQIEFHKAYKQSFSLPPFKTYGHSSQPSTLNSQLAATTNSAGVPAAELRENRAKQGIEIKFACKPADAVLQPLRDQWPTWKWSRFSQVWYARDNETNRAWAKNFLDGAATAAIPPAAPVPEPTTLPAPAPAAPSIPIVVSIATQPIVVHDNPPPGGWTSADKVRQDFTVDDQTFAEQSEAEAYARVASRMCGTRTLAVTSPTGIVAEYHQGQRKEQGQDQGTGINGKGMETEIIPLPAPPAMSLKPITLPPRRPIFAKP